MVIGMTVGVQSLLLYRTARLARTGDMTLRLLQ